VPDLLGEMEDRRLRRIRDELLERERVEDLPEWYLAMGTTGGQMVSMVLGGDGVRV
jgi:hypothetical protein